MNKITFIDDNQYNKKVDEALKYAKEQGEKRKSKNVTIKAVPASTGQKG